MQPAALAALKILVIEDQSAIRAMVTRYLRSFGCQAIFEAEDGETALPLLAAERPDLVICDVAMKPVDGFELVARMRRLPEVSATPVIFLTGQGRAEAVRKAIALDADAYLVKPVPPAVLRERIEKVVARARRTVPDPPS
jgi:two-component system chemotaxis response regulator CheY